MTFPLVSANHLADYIIGTVLEACDIEVAVSKYALEIADRVHNQCSTVEEIAGEMSAKFESEGVVMNTFNVENIYSESPESQHNKSVWSSANNLAAGRPLVGSVSPPYCLTISPILNHGSFRDPGSWINFPRANKLQISNTSFQLPRGAK
jgi:hypothetical protein